MVGQVVVSLSSTNVSYGIVHNSSEKEYAGARAGGGRTDGDED